MPFHILMSVYMYDGTVAISHGGIEIGQGINTKVSKFDRKLFNFAENKLGKRDEASKN